MTEMPTFQNKIEKGASLIIGLILFFVTTPIIITSAYNLSGNNPGVTLFVAVITIIVFICIFLVATTRTINNS